jgi:hypothetical protein
MKRFSLLLLSGMLFTSFAFAGKFVTASGGDPTPISSNDGSFTLTPINGGGLFFYTNIGPNSIADLIVNLTATADPGKVPYKFQSSGVTPTQGQKSELLVLGFQEPPINTPLLNWDFSSYIFSTIALTETTTGFDCAGDPNARDACLTIEFSGGSIPVNGDFGFDLNDNFTRDINTETGTFNPGINNTTNPPAGGFAGVTVAGNALPGTTTIPEPASLSMLGLAGLVLVGFGRRRLRF